MIKNAKKEKEIGDFSYIGKKKRVCEMSYVTAYNGRNDRRSGTHRWSRGRDFNTRWNIDLGLVSHAGTQRTCAYLPTSNAYTTLISVGKYAFIIGHIVI